MLSSAQRLSPNVLRQAYIGARDQERLLSRLPATAARLLQFAATEAARDRDVQVDRADPPPLPAPAPLLEEMEGLQLMGVNI